MKLELAIKKFKDQIRNSNPFDFASFNELPDE